MDERKSFSRVSLALSSGKKTSKDVSVFETSEEQNQQHIRFIDLFCGIGGFRYGLEQAAKKAKLQVEGVFSSDIDESCQKSYAANFGERPAGDITKVDAASIPDHDLLLAGFPCQPFSILGHKRSFEESLY